jgi:hypothetical protein
MTDVAIAARPLTEAALRGVVAKYARHDRGARLLVVAGAPSWDRPDEVDSDVGPLRVVAAPSVLAARTAIVDHPEGRLVLITPVPMMDLGEEVAARAWKGQIQHPSPWDGVTSLFKVDAIDPTLRDERWMVELLVTLAPAHGYPQPTSQILDRATAWRTLYRTGLGLAADRPSMADVLRWASTGAAAAALQRIPADALPRIADQLVLDAGPGARPLLDLARTAGPGDALRLGLVIDALWPTPDPVARTRFEERHLAGRGLTDDAANDWAKAARVEAGQRLAAGDDPDLIELVTAADRLLADGLDDARLADSSGLRRGLDNRLYWLGDHLDVAEDTRTSDAVDAADRAIRHAAAHLLSDEVASRLEASRAALRLIRRSPADEIADGALRDLAMEYLDEGAWVDAARHRIATGETIPALAEVYGKLLAAIDAERRERDRRFAVRVAAEAATLANPTDLVRERPLPIEHVLDRIVAPLAADRPVLLLVIDGLSYFAAVPILSDLRNAGWTELGPNGSPLPPVVAALPTVTNVSRSTLLCGRLQTGAQPVERDGFGTHPGLVEAASGQPPSLFHFKELKPQDGHTAPEVRAAIADSSQRVVGVVVNAVDDHLAKGAQLQLAEGLEGVPLLRPLLDAATEAGRLVIITSDHGHILGDHQRVVSAPGGGERFRPADGTVAEDEIEVTGRRVLRGDGNRIVLAADDGVRYNAVGKHGYHGGATPAEVLCPLVVLATGSVAVDRWEPVAPAAPAWWDPTRARLDIEIEDSAPVAAMAHAARDEDKPQLSLLDPALPAPPAASATRPAWLTALFDSDRLALQRTRAGRARIDDDDLAVLLRVLVAGGGTVSGESLARTLKLPPTRLRGKLEAARQLLDVDDYQILRIETDGTARLNAELLAQQFQIPLPAMGDGR